uniref:Uncharacterized protein n=1 Tax=Myoviridae sp. ctCo31 TaxID=2825053 RepID=A0A8S5ULZ7_9CAUD|nr:MAG TPA: hypothetical protein [Myoviridae sp. ctCo31]
MQILKRPEISGLKINHLLIHILKSEIHLHFL